MIYKITVLTLAILALHTQGRFSLVSSNDIDLLYTDMSEDIPIMDRLLLSTFLKSTTLPQYTCNKVECRKEGESCDPSNPTVEPCLYGYFCNATDEKCLAAPEAGENCTEDSDCKDYLSGAYCDQKVNECAVPLGIDSLCDDKSVCPYHSECSKDKNVCKTDFISGFGEKCSLDGSEGSKCRFGLICEDSVCVNPPSLGESCNVSTGCKIPYYCSEERGVCIDFMSLNESESCASTVYCKEDLICSRNGTCVKKMKDDGKKCSTHSDCEIDSFCACNYKKGEQKCKRMTKSKDSLKDSFKKFAYCVARQPDYDVTKCFTEAIDVYTYSYEGLLWGSCVKIGSDSIKKSPPAADLLVPIAFIVVLLIFIGVVLYDSKKSEKKKKTA